ncbi:MAG: hypothetical protein AAF204_00635 [Pseudomonadota bacterium]
MNKFFTLSLASISLLGLGACAVNEVLREQVAMRVASPAWMIKRTIETDPYALTAFERMHERDKTAALYIGGDGEAHKIKGALFDPTPRNPVALHLAAMDKSENVAYLARPCQYTGLLDHDIECSSDDWHTNKYSSQTLSAYGATLDGIKARYGVTGFHIVGYNGGATLAALLSAQRNDILTLRTVAGRFDLDALGSSLLTLSRLPQHHFIGGQDTITPPNELHGYLQALGQTECADYTLIQDAEHEKGWVNKWPELLKTKPPTCFVPAAPTFVPIERPEPIYVPRMGGSKK